MGYRWDADGVMTLKSLGISKLSAQLLILIQSTPRYSKTIHEIISIKGYRKLHYTANKQGATGTLSWGKDNCQGSIPVHVKNGLSSAKNSFE
jgi:hypothetical protein